MAEQDQEQKTEEPTGKRMQKARTDGQVARSSDLVFATMLVATAGLMSLFGSGVIAAFLEMLTRAGDILPASLPADASLFAVMVLRRAAVALLPFLAILFPLVAAAALVQVGFHFVPGKLRLRPEKLVPNLSPTKFVNGRSLIETATSLLKLVFLAAAYTKAVWGELEILMATGSMEALATAGVRLVIRLLIYVGMTLFVIGLLDFVLRSRDLKKQLRMTKQEVKQEAKDSLGDPEVKGRIKARQRQMAMQRMMDEVPKASVVVTNPTHYAVAIRYQPQMAAPRVVAKGRDFVAQRIKELAREAGVPVLENRTLARALHDSVRPGDEIPPQLYKAVAEVLAAVMKTRRRVGRTA